VLATAETSVSDAQDRGLVLIAYEAGQHLTAYGNAVNNDNLTELFLAGNRDPGMGALYSDYLNGWKDAGGQLMVMFNYVDHYTKWGSWGLLEYQNQAIEAAPKYQSTMEFVNQQSQWW
ncbi:MAG: cellulose-binding protein, partial [Nannocystaceae bacterium]